MLNTPGKFELFSGVLNKKGAGELNHTLYDLPIKMDASGVVAVETVYKNCKRRRRQ